MAIPADDFGRIMSELMEVFLFTSEKGGYIMGALGESAPLRPAEKGEAVKG